MAQRFWTADLHLGQHNIIKYCDRPFKSVEDMHKSLYRNFNQRVQPEDTVMHVGDFCCYGRERGEEGLRIKPAEYEAGFNGKWIHFRGNHDDNNGLKFGIQTAIIRIGTYYAYVTHIPPHPYTLVDQIDWPDFIVCGHIHEKWKIKAFECYDFNGDRYDDIPMINVGIDQHRFMPITDSELIGIYEQWKGLRYKEKTLGAK